MTVDLSVVRRQPSTAELQRAWRALTNGEYAGAAANGPARWERAAGEVVVPLLGCPGSFGATTVAVALATATADNTVPRSARVVECCPPTGSGLVAAADAELGVVAPGWSRGRRGDGVLLDRRTDGAADAPQLPVPPASEEPGLTVLDVCRNPDSVLAGGGWLAGVLRQAPTVVAVVPSSAPAFRQLDAMAELLPQARLVVVSVGTPIQFWPAAARRSIGGAAEAAYSARRVVRVPIKRRWAAYGLTADPIPSWLLAAGAQIRMALEREGTLT